LLVSVRSVEEAQAALAGGADLIDVKEPTRGPLGRAEHGVIAAILAVVGGRVPVSAAMGEWVDWSGGPIPENLTFTKWGLARLKKEATAPVFRLRILRNVANSVLVAYADGCRVGSPAPELLARTASDLKFPAFLIDTAIKDGTALLDWIEPATLARTRFQLAHAGVPMAMAGSLDAERIRKLAPLVPDWFAVRGAVCDGGRNGTVSEAKVRELKAIIAELQTPAGED
jgi:uncharacterized protein (UPF0264 family)